ncbi:hypothetical protein C922_01621 [Plasmodium inui San Antonio 1]|uniref:Uncharacterized protein n=1 Tax=Plasmodium inui San Antonio 1 TaxID=1237626 RepID=W7AGA9_9APIC|nr:hypothetical protein C922_01621 [Plasmodium inui San Antonio 1]EUD68009.1 hypothetical protein C922_01621 [Plasmodium inui San Antonio 1]
MGLFRRGKKNESEKETLQGYKLPGPPKEPSLKSGFKNEEERDANKEKEDALKFKASGSAKNKKKKDALFSFARLNFFGRSKSKKTLGETQRNPSKEEPLLGREVKEIFKDFETLKEEAKGEAKEIEKGTATEEAKREAVNGTTNVEKAKVPTQRSATEAELQRNGVHTSPSVNEELLDILTEDERKSIQVVSLIDGSSNGDSSETNTDRKDDSAEKDVPLNLNPTYSIKKQKSGTNLSQNKHLLMKKSNLSEGMYQVDKKKSYPPKKEHDENDLVISPNAGGNPVKEMQTKKSILKNIIKMPISYASKSFKRDLSASKESAKLGIGANETREGKIAGTKEGALKSQDTTDSIYLQRSDHDKGDVSSFEEINGMSEDTNYTGKMNFNNSIPNFNLTSKKNVPRTANTKDAAPMIISKLKMNKKNSNIGSGFEHADDPNDFKRVKSTLTRQDIRAKKSNLIRRVKLMEKNLLMSKEEQQEDGTKNIHRKMTNDILEGGGISFNLHPPLLVTENSFDICPISPIEDIIEVIHSIWNDNKEETISKLKKCKENNEKSSSVLKKTLDKLNGPEDSVVTNLTKNMSLQQDYLVEVDEVVRSVSED